MKKTFIRTKNVKQFVSLMDELQKVPPNIPKMALVYGEHGLGKSQTIQWWADKNDSVYVRANQGMTSRWLLSEIVEELGEEAYWHLHDNFEIIENILREHSKVIIVDEIDYLIDKNIIETLRDLHDKTACPVVLVGMGAADKKLARYPHLMDRIYKKLKFEKFKGETNPDAIKWLYYDKTKERLSDLRAQNPYWNEVLDREFEYINGKKYRGIASLKSGIDIYVQKLCKTGKETVIHGDYCFSNILFDSSNYNFKLVDPRGRLNNEPTIYGDPRYDIAKLRHSIAGFYDFIVHGLFRLKENKTGFEYEIKTSVDYSILEMIFNKYAELNGYNPQEIKFIEGLLFLSMIPLHKDNFSRQKVFYLKAIELLNDTVKIRGKLNNEKVLSLVRSRG